MQLACDLAACAPIEYRDEIICAAAQYLARRDDPQRHARYARRHPELSAAMALENNKELSDVAKVLTFGRVPNSEIAQRLGVSTLALGIWRLLFFDVANRLQATYWFEFCFIRPIERRGDRQLGFQLRRALHGGSAVTRSMLDMETQELAAAPDRLDAASEKLAYRAEIALGIAMNDSSSAIRVIRECVRLMIASPKIQHARTQRDYLDRCGERREQQLYEMRQRAEAAEAELAALKESLRPPTTADERVAESPPVTSPQTHAA
jgi:hypothetical protein